AGFTLRGAHAARRHRAWAFGLLLALLVPALVVTLPSLRVPAWRAAAQAAPAYGVPASLEPSSQVDRARATIRPAALVPGKKNGIAVEPPRARGRVGLATVL